VQTRALTLGLAVLLASLSPLVPAQQSSNAVELDIAFDLNPDNETVGVTMSVEDPGPLSELQLGFGELRALEDQPRLTGSWTQEDSRAIADLEESPNAKAKWTASGAIRVESQEGTGRTTHVGDQFAVVKSGSMVPSIRYSFPQDESPKFDSELTVDVPEGWLVRGPWDQSGQDSFLLDRPLPRGFVAASDELEDKRLGEGDEAYDIARLAGAREDPETEQLLLKARSYLGGIYGPTDRVQFIVTAPNPMFHGGLGSPAGVFLHADTDARVVAHELVHSFQGMQFSREPTQASVWLAEGSAVVHGSLLEVAADVKTRDQVREFLQSRANEANRDGNAVDLTTAVYNSGNERAAYTKGPVVVTALDERIREATDNQFSLVSVLGGLNERAAESDGRYTMTTSDLEDAVANVTGYDPFEFFEEYVYGPSVPDLGSIFPDALSVRVESTTPSPPVAGKTITLNVRLTNADTNPTSIEAPILVNGTEMGQLVANVSAGETVDTKVTIPPLDRGQYRVTIEGASAEFRVLRPAKLSVAVTTWPRTLVAGQNVTLGAEISNEGQAPFDEPVTLELDGEALRTDRLRVPTGETSTLAHTVDAMTAGPHTVTVRAENGTALASRTITVDAAPDRAATPTVGWVGLAMLAAALARLGPSRARD
jgi:hypothetical protein